MKLSCFLRLNSEFKAFWFYCLKGEIVFLLADLEADWLPKVFAELDFIGFENVGLLSV